MIQSEEDGWSEVWPWALSLVYLHHQPSFPSAYARTGNFHLAASCLAGHKMCHGVYGVFRYIDSTFDFRWQQKELTQSLIIPLPKKGDLKQCQNYRTISLISHPSKTMLWVILNQPKTKAEELLAEEQAGFRPGRSTVEQQRSSLQRQHYLFHSFMNFMKAFGRVWHAGL